MQTTARRIEITLDGHCPPSLRNLLGTRYVLDPVVSHSPSTLVIDNLDQASLRAILLLLWDAGLDVVSLSSGP